MFRVGQEVRCVNNTNVPQLTKGDIYKIAKITDLGGLIIEGVPNSKGFEYAGFTPTRFKLLIQENYPLITYSKILEEVPVGAN